MDQRPPWGRAWKLLGPTVGIGLLTLILLSVFESRYRHTEAGLHTLDHDALDTPESSTGVGTVQPAGSIPGGDASRPSSDIPNSLWRAPPSASAIEANTTPTVTEAEDEDDDLEESQELLDQDDQPVKAPVPTRAPELPRVDQDSHILVKSPGQEILVRIGEARNNSGSKRDQLDRPTLGGATEAAGGQNGSVSSKTQITVKSQGQSITIEVDHKDPEPPPAAPVTKAPKAVAPVAPEERKAEVRAPKEEASVSLPEPPATRSPAPAPTQASPDDKYANLALRAR